jgi:Ni/Co efflux regulator RcnB
MTKTLHSLILAGCLALPAMVLAQQPATTDSEPAIAPAAQEQTDVGTLQAELARVEAERQDLAQRLAGSVDTQELQRLRETNQELQNRQIENDVRARALLERQRQQWVMIGGGTVLVSLLIGFVLARSSKRKRNEWIN